MKIIEEKSGQDADGRPEAGDEQRQAGARGEVAARRWRELSGSGRSAPRAAQRAGDPLDHHLRARRAAEKSMLEKFAAEILAASKNEGGAIKKSEDTHKMAEANKAFAHYRW